MNRPQQTLAFAFLAALFICSCNIASAQPTGKLKTRTTRITQMVDQTTYAAIEEAAKAAGYACITGKVSTIPLSALKGAATHIAHLKFGRWLACKQICAQFQIWAASHNQTPPFTGDPAFNVEIDLVDASGTTLMKVTVPYFAKCDSKVGTGKATGYCAPIGPGGATMKLDVFGDGSLILERIQCPCP